jgi:branched-subunit amino acid aminotransferase/4-amino-4-deoxychorismate lyase
MSWTFVKTLDENASCYQDIIIESMLCLHGNMPLWDNHSARIQKVCNDITLPIDSLCKIKEQILNHPDIHKTTPFKVRLLIAYNPSVIEWTFQLVPITTIDTVKISETIYLPQEGKMTNWKTKNNLKQIVHLREKKKLNTHTDILLCDATGRCLESTMANLFVIKDNIIITPPLRNNVIAGVMRQYILEKQVWDKYEIMEKKIHFAEELRKADGIFLTNAVRGILPVESICGRTMPKDVPLQLRSILFSELNINL